MTNTIRIQDNFTPFQLVLPLDLGMKIPEDDELRTYCELMKGINLESYFTKQSRLGRNRKNRVAILNVILFGFMTDIRSTRKIEKACKTDIRFMYLLGNVKPPSHVTINEVINNLGESIELLFLDIFKSINKFERIDTDITYIDGTKIEADANRYTFVWKKSIEKHKFKLNEKINKNISDVLELLGEYNKKFEVKESYESGELEILRVDLEFIVLDKGIKFVYGKGKRKDPLQRIYEKYQEYSIKMNEYEKHLKIMGANRNSYSKSDYDATFMRMKTDHMKNGQLKAGYNVQISVSDEYITMVDIYNDRSDHGTFIPFLGKYKELHGKYPIKPVGDAGYGSYDNYYFCLENDIELYQKYNWMKKEKERKYKNNPYLRCNMKRDELGNYICPNNKKIKHVLTYSSKRIKYPNEIKQYECESCIDCEFKIKCTKAKGNRTFTVNETLDDMHKTVRDNLGSKEGIRLKIQRSIQVEGAFGVIKEDMKFRRFTRVGKNSVKLEVTLLTIGYNLKKYHNKKHRKDEIIQ